MTVVAMVVTVLLATAIVLALARIVRGPSTLDRIVATDVLLAITVGAIATEAAYTRDPTGLPILLGLSLLGAVGSIAIGRFADPAQRAGAAVRRRTPRSVARERTPRTVARGRPLRSATRSGQRENDGTRS